FRRVLFRSLEFVNPFLHKVFIVQSQHCVADKQLLRIDISLGDDEFLPAFLNCIWGGEERTQRESDTEVVQRIERRSVIGKSVCSPIKVELIEVARDSNILEPACIALLDRKSTRLNSSHVKISYAVFCLKKKNTVT